MSKNKYDKIAEKEARSVSEEALKLSFKYIDWSIEDFFLHGLEADFYKYLFSCFDEISKAKEKDITQQTHPSLSPKSIFNNDSSSQYSFPDSVFSQLKQAFFLETRDEDDAASRAKEIMGRAFEVRILKNSGRLHGFVWNNTFNLVWFDPAHNLYPAKTGIREQAAFATVRCFSPQECEKLKEANRQLENRLEQLWEEVDELLGK